MIRFVYIVLLLSVFQIACSQNVYDESNSFILDSLELKMTHSDTLSYSDWVFLFENIRTIADDISEGFGNVLFNHLKQNEESCKTVLCILDTYSKEIREELLLSLMEIMSIDIFLEGYNSYYDFTSDFPVFSDNSAAMDLYYYIINLLYFQ